MSGLVSGYSGIIAPPNLATNGAFAIDQRGTFSGYSYLPVKAGDYVVDAWYVSTSTTVDYLSCRNQRNATNHDHLGFKGYGKKGQVFKIVSRDTNMYGQLGETFQGDPTPAREMYTAAVRSHVPSNSVPLLVSVEPRHRTLTTETFEVYGSHAIVTENRQGESVSIWQGTNDDSSSVNRSDVLITLQEDGEFEVWLQSFRLFAGAYKNPPKYAPVPYADDLSRCQRYYQKGRVATILKAIQYDTDHARAKVPINLATDMSSTPTMTMEAARITANTGNGSVSDRLTQVSTGLRYLDATDVRDSSFAMMLFWQESTYSAMMWNYGVDLIGDWTAEVV